jgi:GT2 family glycosyltransferase
MPGSPQVTDRTWFGLAKVSDSGVSLEGALAPWDASYDYAQVLVMGQDGPTEWLLLSPDEVSVEGVTKRLDPVGIAGRSAPDHALPTRDMSIAICTRDRPDSLEECLNRFRNGAAGNYGVLIIDNAPKTDATKKIVSRLASDGMNISYAVEVRPGLARARNAALRHATTEFVAFTDDDARPDFNWAEFLHRGFLAGEDVALVTGIVPPAEIETEAQALFEKKLKWSNNLTPETFSMAHRDEYPWPFPYSAGHFGTGANFAIRRQTALDVGGFDESLGAGTRTEGGEDMEMFVRVIRAGHELRYQPSAIVWHIHRRDEMALRKVLFGYGKGLSATALAEFLKPGRLEMVKGTLRGARNLAQERQGELDYGMPWDHLALELLGVAYGPLAYAVERLRGPKRQDR